MQIKKILLWLILCFIPVVVHAQPINYDAENTVLFTGSLSTLQNSQNTVGFIYGGNDFGGLIFLRTPEIASTPEVVQLESTTKTCSKRLKGIYYNNQRGMRFWPLDQDTLTILKTITGTYDDMQMTGGWFIGCSGSDDTYVYGEITNTRSGYSYELIAGVQMNFGGNTYLPRFGQFLSLPLFGQTLHYTDTNSILVLSGYLFDNYGGIGIVRGSGRCSDVRDIDPSTVCAGVSFVQTSNCGTTQYATGTRDCSIHGGTPSLLPDNCCEHSNISGANADCIDYSPSYYDRTCQSLAVHESAPAKACKYQDEAYIDRGAFSDTLHNRGFNYIEVMRKSCLHRGRGTSKGLWKYDPNSYITKAEVIKTLVKIMGIAFNDFTIQTENAPYPYVSIFADVPKTNRFSRYTEYAYLGGLIQDLYTTKNNNKYFQPNSLISRNQIIEKIMMVYHDIYTGTINIVSHPSHLVDVPTMDLYYLPIREAETIGIISGVPQQNGTYKFEGQRNLTRAEFAKMITIPFNGLLFE